MSRPRDYGVRYFPHVCEHGKSMYVLESRYGNDGYSLWWKLLEGMGRTVGLYLDMTDDETVDWLCAKAHVTTERLWEILGVMARLNMVDRELWQEKHILWSQNFVDGVAEVYARRRVPLPQRPNGGATETPAPAPMQAPEPAPTPPASAETPARNRAPSPIYLVCGSHQVSEAYYRRIVRRMGGDEYRAQAVFYRAFTRAEDPIAWIEAGLSDWAQYAIAEETAGGRAVVDKWFERCRGVADTLTGAGAQKVLAS